MKNQYLNKPNENGYWWVWNYNYGFRLILIEIQFETEDKDLEKSSIFATVYGPFGIHSYNFNVSANTEFKNSKWLKTEDPPKEDIEELLKEYKQRQKQEEINLLRKRLQELESNEKSNEKNNEKSDLTKD